MENKTCLPEGSPKLRVHNAAQPGISTATRYAVSACLAGSHCRYDGGSNPSPEVVQLVQAGRAVPLCPEAMAHLPIPRPPCEQRDGRVFSKDGTDVTAAFAHGAAQAAHMALEQGCTAAILKARSPSCSPSEVYDGTFSKQLTPGRGLWAALLHEAGLPLYTEEQLPPELDSKC